PAVVQVDEAARNMYKTLKVRFLDENKILNISDILYRNSTESTNDNNRYCDSIVLFWGILIFKEYRIATTLPKFLDKFILSNEELYLHNKTILLRIRDIITMDIIDQDILCPLEIIPGRHLVLKLVAVKTSTIYCYSYVALDRLPIEDKGKFEVRNGTSAARVFAKDELVLHALMSLKCQKICLDAARKKIEYSWKQSENTN
ncbi:5250_t:CDS:2, partial [Dentiscutata erythropus]